MRYCFHVQGEHDPEGEDLPDLREAKKAAVQLAGEVLRDDPMALWESGDWRLTVSDEHGLVLFSVNVFAIEAAALGR